MSLSFAPKPTDKEGVAAALVELRRRQAEHPFWNNRLFHAFTAGWLTHDDLRFIFSQYHHYSKNFTRFIAAVMANCENDLFRAQLSENLWEEGGGAEPEKRHAQIFREFLKRALGIEDCSAISYENFTRHFVREYLVYCLRGEPAAAAAFMSLGTEGIVARMYEIFVEGLHKAGIDDKHLEFFYIHMKCDDGHALTLENMMASYADEPGWFETCERALDHALTLRGQFFENLYDAVQHRRVQELLNKVQARQSLGIGPGEVLSTGSESKPLYSNVIERLNVDFSVQRMECGAEVLDPRVVRIPPGKYNEKHRHAHETIFHVVEGSGRVLVDDKLIDVQKGDTVFVPRWTLHQSQNSGSGEMVLLAITDFGFTGKAFVGDYERTARLKKTEG